jgi:hypothetical protein
MAFCIPFTPMIIFIPVTPLGNLTGAAHMTTVFTVSAAYTGSAAAARRRTRAANNMLGSEAERKGEIPRCIAIGLLCYRGEPTSKPATHHGHP